MSKINIVEDKFKNEKIQSYSLHAIIWLLLFLLNYFFFKRPGINIDFSFNLKIWLVYLVLFYINYSILIPYFLFVKKYFQYIILLLILLSGLFLIKSDLENKKFDEFGRGTGLPSFSPGMFNKAKSHLVPAPFPPPFIKNMPLRRSFIPRFSQLLIIVLASISFRFIQKLQDDEKIKSEIEKERISTELSFLKQQVNPHFLFNAINSIYSLSLSGKPSTSDSILKLSSIIRYMLYETDRKFVTLRNEIQIIKDYIELQKLRITEKVKLTFQVTGETEQYSIAPLLMIPLIENAFKHGVDNISNSFIDINIEIKDDTLYLRIRNSIISRTELNDEKSGIGIKNIIRRLELIYPKAHFFNASNDDGYFLVLLRLALKK